MIINPQTSVLYGVEQTEIRAYCVACIVCDSKLLLHQMMPVMVARKCLESKASVPTMDGLVRFVCSTPRENRHAFACFFSLSDKTWNCVQSASAPNVVTNMSLARVGTVNSSARNQHPTKRFGTLSQLRTPPLSFLYARLAKECDELVETLPLSPSPPPFSRPVHPLSPPGLLCALLTLKKTRSLPAGTDNWMLTYKTTMVIALNRETQEEVARHLVTGNGLFTVANRECSAETCGNTEGTELSVRGLAEVEAPGCRNVGWGSGNNNFSLLLT